MSNKRTVTTTIGLLAATLLLAGCGQQAFLATAKQEAQAAPGTLSIPAKVDVLLVQDDSGSALGVNQVSATMPQVLSNLESSGWDYHFATIPLTSFRSVSQVAASHYDGNWGSSWIAPFPGAAQWGPETVNSANFRTTGTNGTYSDFVVAKSSNAVEWGFDNIMNEVYDAMNGATNYIRPDAMLAIIVVGNGNDTSRVNYCTTSGGVLETCDAAGQPLCSQMSQWGAPGATCASEQLSRNYYTNIFKSFKSSANMLRFYAAVSGEKVSNETCLGGNAFVGTRYQQMASALSGQSYDICSGASNAVSQALTSMGTDLSNIRLTLQTRYLIISNEPNVATIVVTRDDGVVIPQSASNGWTYAGYVSNGYQIDSPFPMNQFSGYAIELHGSYKLQGSQTATVTYTQAGVHSTI